MFSMARNFYDVAAASGIKDAPCIVREYRLYELFKGCAQGYAFPATGCCVILRSDFRASIR